MTAHRLQGIVRVLANSSWCRYWLDYNEEKPVIMAIQCRGFDGFPLDIPDAKSNGFTELENCMYTVPRTNEDGTPYESKLP